MGRSTNSTIGSGRSRRSRSYDPLMRRITLYMSLVVAGGLAAVGYALWMGAADPAEFVVSGIIEADDVHVGSKVAGRVLRVASREGQRVKTGDLLVVLEPDELKASLAEAQGSLKEAEAKLAEIVAGSRREEIDQAKADWLAAKTQYENSEKSRRRMKDMIDRALVAHQDYDDARTKAEADEHRMKSVRKNTIFCLRDRGRKRSIRRARAPRRLGPGSHWSRRSSTRPK